jgi:hypothetical protein
MIAAPSPASAVECVQTGAQTGVPLDPDDGDQVTNTACGENSDANGTAGFGTAYGNQTDANSANASAFGTDADAVGTDSTSIGANSDAVQGASALGGSADAFGTNSVSIGWGSTTDSGAPQGIAIGAANDFSGGPVGGAKVLDANGIAIGTEAVAGTTAKGGGGENAVAVGFQSQATATDSAAFGSGANALGVNSISVGFNSLASGPNDTVGGANSEALSDSSTIWGANTVISKNSANSSAFGAGVTIEGNSANSMALGAGTLVGANASGAVAMGTDSAGNGAVATLENQFMLGTSNHTYTAPGITSNLSRSRQSGPLEVVTSDANGNLATDGGALFRRLDNFDQDVDRLESGVAIAMSAVGPDLTGAERFGLSLNWGGFEGASAIGGGATAVVWRGNGSRFALTGGIGVGLEGEDAVGGRAGGQWTW